MSGHVFFKDRWYGFDDALYAGARLLDGQFTGVKQAIGTHKNRDAAAKFLRAFVEDVKASGLVAEAISKNGVQGVSVAPPAPR